MFYFFHIINSINLSVKQLYFLKSIESSTISWKYFYISVTIWRTYNIWYKCVASLYDIVVSLYDIVDVTNLFVEAAADKVVEYSGKKMDDSSFFSLIIIFASSNLCFEV